MNNFLLDKTPEQKKDFLRNHGFTFPGDPGHMTKTYKATFSVGVGKNKYNKEIPFAHAIILRDKATYHAAVIFGGCTVTENYGAWKDGRNNVISEESWDFIIVSDKRDKFREFAVYLRDLYNQSAVLLTVSEVESEFV